MWHDIAIAVRDLQRALSGDSYRPELHYMRGPGPKCLAKRIQNARPPVTAAIEAAPILGEIAKAHA